MDGRRLKLHMTGINNQNFILRDEETGSWWQQATGEAFFGPLRGRRLRPVFADEVSFAVWRREHPEGRVMQPAADPAWERWSAGWEAKTARMPLVSSFPGPPGPAGATGPGGARRGGPPPVPLAPRSVVLGLTHGAIDRAYPLDVLRRQGAVLDDLGGTGVVILVGEDGNSLRAFESTLDGRRVPFFVKLDTAGTAAPRRWIDGAGCSEWDFQGRAVTGQWRGRQLRPVPAMKDYWFDWWRFHPRTSVYMGGGAD
jgi:hypothetical protein